MRLTMENCSKREGTFGVNKASLRDFSFLALGDLKLGKSEEIAKRNVFQTMKLSKMRKEIFLKTLKLDF